MARENDRRDMRRTGEMRGSAGQHDGRGSYIEPLERKRRGGGSYDAGPGREGLPDAMMMDRPPMPCGAFARTGDSRRDYDPQQRKIQDAEPHYRAHK
jgi:hypothetical protein